MRRMALTMLPISLLLSCRNQPGPEIEAVWARDSVGRTANAAIFLTIRSDVRDRLIGASSSAAEKTALMTFQGDGGTMKMKYVEAIEIPPGETVSLNPAGLHVWLEGLRHPLQAGQTVPLTLRFMTAGERQVLVQIIEPSAAPPTP